jgi:hypothetical protein
MGRPSCVHGDCASCGRVEYGQKCLCRTGHRDGQLSSCHHRSTWALRLGCLLRNRREDRLLVAAMAAVAGAMRRRALLKVVSAAVSLTLLIGVMAFAGGVAAITGRARQSAGACTPAGTEATTAPNVTGAGLEVPNAGRLLYELTPRQESIARTYIAVGKQFGIPRSGQIIAIMMALQESSLRMLANTNVPASLHFPNDGVGRDHDSLGSAQQRPAAGWGTVEQLMDASYNARAFYGGPSGPNRGSPSGLLDIPGWQGMDKGPAAQAVQVSAFPELYARWEPAATAIVAALEGGTAPASCTDSTPSPLLAGSLRNLSKLRQEILKFTQEGLGGRYVWGGTALKPGIAPAMCSGSTGRPELSCRESNSGGLVSGQRIPSQEIWWFRIRRDRTTGGMSASTPATA